MQRLRIVVTAAALVVLAASACSSSENSSDAITSTKTGPGTTTENGTRPKEVSAKDFNPGNFDNATTIDNEWFPLQPGTQFFFEGAATEDGERIPHRVVFTVTDLTKVIEGVRTVVVWDRDYSAGELVEAELALFAQDNDGNVWHLGQYPEEYEEGKFAKAPAWIAGLKGARAGISMKANPRLEASDYSQGFAPPPINWIDRARVYQMGQRTCVPFDCYEDVLVTEEFERNKPGAYQLKYYARGVGNVRVGWRGRKEDEREVLVLVDLVHLSPEALARVREAALELEKRAYRISKDVYAHTPPAEGP
jgi:hypothetical protein